MKKYKTTLALDLGSSSIKFLEWQEEGTRRFVKSLSVVLLPAELQNTISVKSSAYIDFVRNVILERGISAESAVVSISGQELEIGRIIIPAMKPKELAASVRWEAKNIISIPLKNAVLDYVPGRQFKTDEGEKQELCISAVPKNTAEDILSLLEELKLEPIGFPAGCAAAWLALKNHLAVKDKKTVALIDLGAEKTQISIYYSGMLVLSRTISIAGNKFTSVIQDKLKITGGEPIDREKAEYIKCKYGIYDSKQLMNEGIDNADISSALRPLLEDLTSEINRLFLYYKDEHSGMDVESVIIYGGASKLRGIDAYLSEGLGMPVVLPDSTSIESLEMQDSLREELEGKQPFFTNLIGAVLVNGKRIINLLPARIREKREAKKQNALWLKIWIISGVISFALYAILGISAWLEGRALLRLKNKYSLLSKWQDGLNEHSASARDLKDKMFLCSTILSGEPFWKDVLIELGNLTPDNMALEKISIDKNNVAGEPSIMIITGNLYPGKESSQQILTVFMGKLEKTHYFGNVTLIFSRNSMLKDKKVLGFKIECKAGEKGK